MDTTVRNLDPEAYRQLKARAALEGKSVGQALNDAIRAWIESAPPVARTRSIGDLQPEPWGPGNARASEEIDRLLYASKS